MGSKEIKTASTNCPNCGGKLAVDSSKETVECLYCGTNFPTSAVINESDAVRIEKIKSKTYKDVEMKKIEHEKEQSKNKAEKDEIEAFKKSKFSKVLLVFFAIAVIFFFASETFFAKLLSLVQAGLFIISWLMGIKVVKEQRKGLRIILAIIAFVLIIPISSIDGSASGIESQKIVWDEMVMSEILPQPSINKGYILTNSDEHLSVSMHNASKEDYANYVADCKEKGFTIESENDVNSYNAYNVEGYKLYIYYSEYTKEYNISLDAPIKMKENAWVENTLSKLVPKPKSKVGKVQTESERFFTYYAGETSQQDFVEYANSVFEAGFTNNYSKGDDYFIGKNIDGYKVDIRYAGNKTMSINISAPAKDETKNDTVVEQVTDKEETTSSSEKPAQNITSNNSSNSVGKEFKAAMDSYEKFMNEYVAFMKKYEKSNGADASLLKDYAKYMSKYAAMCKDFAKWEDEEMNAAEAAYYAKVQTRVNKKLLEVAY